MLVLLPRMYVCLFAARQHIRAHEEPGSGDIWSVAVYTVLRLILFLLAIFIHMRHCRQTQTDKIQLIWVMGL